MKRLERSPKASGIKSPFIGLEGTYKGFTPTDESAVMLGEIEVVIDDNWLLSHVATGLGIEEERVSVDLFERLSTRAIREMEINPRRFRIIEYPEGSTFIFSRKDSKKNAGVSVISGGITQLFGPWPLYTPVQVERGMFDQALDAIESDFGRVGIIPRLNNNGKAPVDNSPVS